MKKFKDFLYKSNDIILAIVILIAALAVIGWRTQVIMDYPKTLTEASEQQEEKNKEAEQAKANAAKTEAKKTDTTQSTTDGVYKDGKLVKDVSIEIKAGASSEEAVKPLIDAKLFSSYDDFSKTCSSAGANPENVRADKFTFSAGATKADIAKKVTQ